MSAYIVNPAVIARLAVYRSTDDYRQPRIDIPSAHVFAEILIRENIRSIEYRYPDSKGKAIEYFFVNMTKDKYRDEVKNIIDNPHLVEPSMLQISQDMPEYDYQACECDDYEESIAAKTMAWIAARFVREYRNKHAA